MPTPRKKPSSPSKKAGARKGGSGKAARPPGPTHPDSMPADVIEFITAVDEYKRRNQRPFPSWSEILEIVKGLGYQKSA